MKEPEAHDNLPAWQLLLPAKELAVDGTGCGKPLLHSLPGGLFLMFI
jgi:hypothetical protein